MSNTVSQLLIEVDSDGVRTLTGDLDLLTKAGKKNEKQTETLEQSTRKLTKQFELQARNAGKSANQIKILDLKAKGATKAQLDAARAAMKNAEAMKKQADAARFAAQSAGETGGAFRAMRGSTQQLSWQLQDVAVQAQMGTSAFTIMGQQGPQIASIFGSGGAVAGAVIAFGSILAGGLYYAITGTSEVLSELEDDVSDLVDEFDDLTGAMRELALLQAAKEQDDLNKAIKNGHDEIKRLGEVYVAAGNYIQHTKQSTKDYGEAVLVQNAIIQRSGIRYNEISKAIDNVTTSTEDLLDGLTDELATLRMSETQLVGYNLAMAGATHEQIQLGMEISQTRQDEEAAVKVREDAASALKKQNEKLASYSEGLQTQLDLLGKTGAALSYYQAALKGGTIDQILANAALLEKIRLKKEEIAAADVAAKKKDKADDDAVKAQARADANALKQGDKAQKLMQDIEQANMTELEQLEAKLTAKGGLLLQFLEQDHITLDQYLAMDAQLRATYDAAELLANKEKNDELLESDKAYADAKASLDNQVLSSASALVGNLANAAEEGSGAQKALFAIQKAIAIATAIVNTELAAATALAPPPLGLGPIAGAGYAQVIRAMGYASVGIMAGTAIAGGRALGGQVRGGESYLVGERGPELLTMGTSGRIATNENLKNAVGGDNNNTSNVVNVNFSVQANDTAGFDRLLQSRKGQIVGMINQAVNNRGRASIV